MKGQQKAEFATDRVFVEVPPRQRIDDLAATLAAIADRDADVPFVALTITPYDLLRVSRLIRPVGGTWPRQREADASAGFAAGFAQGLALGICGMLAILGLWGGSA